VGLVGFTVGVTVGISIVGLFPGMGVEPSLTGGRIGEGVRIGDGLVGTLETLLALSYLTM